MSDLDDLFRLQADTQDMLDSLAVCKGILWVLVGAGVTGFIIWLC